MPDISNDFLVVRSCIICGKELTGQQKRFCSDRECHREKERKSSHKYRQNHPERIERVKEYNRKYRRDNREKLKEYNHKYHRGNTERIKKRQHEYHLKNQEKKQKHDCERYRLSRGLPEDWDLSKESSIEVIMRRWLQESNIEFSQHHYINLENSTKTHIDFYIPEANVCLYCDGDYWHGPERPDILERDSNINKALEAGGYNVVRMTETEILEGNRPWWLGELIPAKW